MERPLLSKAYFTKTPEKLGLYHRDLEPKSTSMTLSDHLTNHATDWFELFHATTTTYTPDNAPRQPDSLTGIAVYPYTHPVDNAPLLALAGVYRYRHNNPSNLLTLIPPVVLHIDTHKGESDHLSYSSAYDRDEAPTALSDTLSIDIAKLMAFYYRNVVLKRNMRRGI